MNLISSILLSLMVYFLSSLVAALPMFFGVSVEIGPILVPIFVAFGFIIRRKKLTKEVLFVNLSYFAFLSICLTILMYLSDGSLHSLIVVNGQWVAIPFFPMLFVLGIMDQIEVLYLCVLMSVFVAILCSALLHKEWLKERHIKKLLSGIAVMVILLGVIDTKLYLGRPERRYGGHGFHYMHGYSSTDFNDYMVYSNPSKLVELPHESQFIIEKESEMPVMDGAEACYPLYAAVAKAVYKGIEQIETPSFTDSSYENGKVVTFTNTIDGFDRLLREEADLFFGARPSADQMELAEEMKIEFEITPIGKEAFVFFVEEDNPVSNLTTDQIKSIYHGDITNWSEVGGENTEIIPFQRPKNSGSQTMMEYFMGDVALKEPKTYEMVSSMVGVIHHVAQYNNEEGAMGYSFRYFVEGLNQEEHVKLLSIDGVAPTSANIQNGSYPLVTNLCLITRKENKNPNVQKMVDFMLSEDGQYLVEKTGYSPLPKQ